MFSSSLNNTSQRASKTEPLSQSIFQSNHKNYSVRVFYRQYFSSGFYVFREKPETKMEDVWVFPMRISNV